MFGLNDLITNLLYIMREMLDVSSNFVLIFCVKKIVFLEFRGAEQKRRTGRIVLGAGIVFLLWLGIELFWGVAVGIAGKSPGLFGNNAFMAALDYALYFAIVGIYGIALLYSSVTGRKKVKWLGVFAVIPALGYVGTVGALYSIPFGLLNLSEAMRTLYASLIDMALAVFFLWLVYGKNRPGFMHRLEYDIENRSLSGPEELAIWILGIWMLLYGLLVDYKMNGVPDWVLAVNFISFFILGVVVTAFIISSSYRRYYYEKNQKYQKTLITTMANLVESRDDNTGGHIHRTAKYVEIIARKLQEEGKFAALLTDRYIQDMIIAAPLHDVGKIHISDAILNKPGKLDDEEFATMKTHSAAGGEIIEQVEQEVGETISYLDIAKEMAEYHHERIDGTGYPHGIRGDAIPVCARILAVADVFDALISKRCYKEPMPLDMAFAIIREEAGEHFDVDVANAFLDSRLEVEQFLKEAEAER